MDLDRLRIFYYVAEAGSFSKCGLPLSKSSVSRHIAALEHQMKAKLFYRHSRGLSMTSSGELLLGTVRSIFSDLEEVKREISGTERDFIGRINLMTQPGWANTVLVQIMAGFVEDNPGIDLRMVTRSNVPEQTVYGFDVAILPSTLNREGLIQQHLVSYNLKLYASPEYIERFGVPKDVEDLKNHRIIGYGDHEHHFKGVDWHLTLGMPLGKKLKPFMYLNVLYTAGEMGLGIVALSPELQVHEKSNLVEVLPDVFSPPSNAFFIYPEHLKKEKIIKQLHRYLHMRINSLKKRGRLSLRELYKREDEKYMSTSDLPIPWQDDND